MKRIDVQRKKCKRFIVVPLICVSRKIFVTCHFVYSHQSLIEDKILEKFVSDIKLYRCIKSLARLGHAISHYRLLPHRNLCQGFLIRTPQFQNSSPSGVLGVKPLALKRAASRKSSGHNTGPDSPDTPSQPLSASMSQRLLNKARVELTKAEMNLPWEHVHEYWAEKRPAWRKWVVLHLSFTNFLVCVCQIPSLAHQKFQNFPLNLSSL